MNDPNPYYPPGAFHFKVAILGLSANPAAVDAAFQEVSGLEREMEFEEVREGGENRFAHRLPKRGKHPNLVLKRGLVTSKSDLADWAEQTLISTLVVPVQPKTVQVMLLGVPADPNQDPPALVTWTFSQVYPVKWLVAPFNSMESAIAVETFELAYAWVERKLGN